MLKIGITGGIGSGKSTAARIFEVLGIPVYYADTAAKRLMNEDPALKKEIEKLFGPEAYHNGLLNREYLAAQVFDNKSKLELLNSVIHPATIRDSNDWMEKQTTSYAIKEAALIFESGSQDTLDFVIGVSAPQSMRIHRAMTRDSISRPQVISRMSKQIEETIKMRLCDFILINDEQQLLLPQVLSLHNQLLELSIKKL
ncbi:MAG: dephospho-CoA kinase [Chitinophagaceae bacterium]|nr:dephospho-CoA kinase [Chitinophagaceae bacterium]